MLYDVYVAASDTVCPAPSEMLTVQFPALGDAAVVNVKIVPVVEVVLPDAVDICVQPTGTKTVNFLLYGALDHPFSEAVVAPVEPAPLEAYRSISEEVSEMEESVGVKVCVPFVVPLADAASVAGAIARPP
jgi:hypothetical protein